MRYVCRLCLVLAVGVLVSGAHAGHRRHAIVNLEQGWCEHGQCARPRVRVHIPSRDLNFETVVTWGSQEGKATAAIARGQHIDGVLRNLLVVDRNLVAKYNACAFGYASWVDWLQKYTKQAVESAVARATLVVAAFDARRKGEIGAKEFTDILRTLGDTTRDQLQTSEELARTVGSDEKGPEQGSEGDPATVEELHQTVRALRDVMAATKSGATKGGDPPTVNRLREWVRKRPSAPLSNEPA